MKHTLLSILSLLIAVNAFAQVCTPEWPVGQGPGIIPDSATNLPAGTENVAYDFVVQFKVLKDTMLGPLPVTVDYIQIDSVSGLNDIPASVPFFYNCNPPTCQFEGDSLGCVRIQGTPVTAGDYPIVVNVKAVAVGGLTLSVPVTFYHIVVNEASGISNINTSAFDAAQNIPNPAKTLTAIEVNLLKPAVVSLILYDVIGKEVSRYQFNGKTGLNVFNLNVQSMKDGVYFYKVSNGEQTITRKMMVDKF
jgi:hypothetical protein